MEKYKCKSFAMLFFCYTIHFLQLKVCNVVVNILELFNEDFIFLIPM